MKKMVNVCLVLVILVGTICFYQPPKLHADYAAFQSCADYCMTQVKWDLCVTEYCLPLL